MIKKLLCLSMCFNSIAMQDRPMDASNTVQEIRIDSHRPTDFGLFVQSE